MTTICRICVQRCRNIWCSGAKLRPGPHTCVAQTAKMDSEPPMGVNTQAHFCDIKNTLRSLVLPGVFVSLNLKFKTQEWVKEADAIVLERTYALILATGPTTRQYLLCDGQEMMDAVRAELDGHHIKKIEALAAAVSTK